jgi:AAA+ ATPase superfamily predicted ATPase
MAGTAVYEWPLVEEFLDRQTQLARLEEWWASGERMPLNLYGRRRSGKSWLLRRFAHGKPAVLLVAHKITPGAQLASFAARLEPVLGVAPSLPDVPTLFRVLLRAARDDKLLAVIDEFPWLLPSTEAAAEAELSAIQAVFEEERDRSQLKLILCGSLVAQMEALQGERSPLHGRLIPLQLQPMRYADASRFMGHLDPLSRFERFAVAGGMPRYLSTLAGGRSLRDVVCRQVLDRNAPLWDEARVVIEQELREPKVYFSILASLASGDKELGEVVAAARSNTATISKYVAVLEDMRIVSRHLPVGAPRTSRGGHWHLRDAFFRFWFRFVFPYQDELESGLRPADLFDTEVAPALADHVAAEFEDWSRDWTRTTDGRDASIVGRWWGPARHDLRRSGARHSEEIDIVGLSRGRVSIVGEAKWQTRPLGPAILTDLDDYKLPALVQAGYKMAATPLIVLLAKAGYSRSLVAAAAARGDVVLVDVPAALNRVDDERTNQ